MAADHSARACFAGKTKAEVLAKAEEIKAKRAQGLDLDAKQPTIAQFSEVWLRDLVKRTRRASTYASYAQMFRLYINPKLGTIRLDELTAARVQGWINMLVDAGQGAATVRNAYLRLRGMLDIAVRYRLISANPAKDVDLPPITNDRARALTLSEARTLLLAADARLDVRKPYTTKDGRSKSLPKLSTRYALLYTETGAPVSPSNLLRHYRLLLSCAGLPSVRLHDLRHTCATLLGERIGDRVIAAILGHTPGTVTARYAKVTLTQMREALEGLYRELTGAD